MNLDEEGKNSLDIELEKASQIRHPLLTQKPMQRRLKSVSSEDVTDKREKFKAPPGWTPPGWSEEKSYQSAKAFMGWQRTIK